MEGTDGAGGPKPARKLLGKVWRHIEALRAAVVLGGVDELAAQIGSSGTGSLWAALPPSQDTDDSPQFFDDAHFQMAQ